MTGNTLAKRIIGAILYRMLTLDFKKVSPVVYFITSTVRLPQELCHTSSKEYFYYQNNSN